MSTLESTKLTRESLRLIRIIAGVTGEKQYEVMARLAKAELERLKAEGKL